MTREGLDYMPVDVYRFGYETNVAEDFEHRLEAGRFADILDLGRSILPDDALEVELEWDCCVISQYSIASGRAVDDRLEFQLAAGHTDCLAKQECGIDADGCGRSASEFPCC